MLEEEMNRTYDEIVKRESALEEISAQTWEGYLLTSLTASKVPNLGISERDTSTKTSPFI